MTRKQLKRLIREEIQRLNEEDINYLKKFNVNSKVVDRKTLQSLALIRENFGTLNEKTFKKWFEHKQKIFKKRHGSYGTKSLRMTVKPLDAYMDRKGIRVSDYDKDGIVEDNELMNDLIKMLKKDKLFDVINQAHKDNPKLDAWDLGDKIFRGK